MLVLILEVDADLRVTRSGCGLAARDIPRVAGNDCVTFNGALLPQEPHIIIPPRDYKYPSTKSLR
jgi:hypothetical protein